jgi:prepilin-type N-terminal cleavage/methylation domain-containing protein
MSTPTHRSSSGFTLIEVVVVMSIITILMGMGIPGIINAQRRADRYATVNILGTIHDACQNNAKQFGSAGTVYGFTLSYNVKSTSYINTQYSSIGITPWVILPGGPITYNTPTGQLQAAIGKEMMWNGNTIEFVDLNLPSKTFRISRGLTILSSPDLTSATGILHVAYEPRTGFAHADFTNATPAGLTADVLSTAATEPVKIELAIWSKGTNPRPTNTFVIQPTGASDVRLAQ